MVTTKETVETAAVFQQSRLVRGVEPGARHHRRAALGPPPAATAAALAFTHGANDAQKTMGVMTLALVVAGAIPSFTVPLWVKLVCGLALTVGTALGGWRIVHTIGRSIYRLRPIDGAVSSSASSLIIGSASLLGAPVSTTHVVSSSVVGVGAARRARHVGWGVVRDMLLAWVVTMPGCAVIAAIASLVGRMLM